MLLEMFDMDNKRLIVIFEAKGFTLDFEGRGEVLDKELRL
jgi:hypothetical protein